jgi:hypothetical protein
MRPDVSWQAQAAQGFDIAHFTIDWDADRVTCPEGKTSVLWEPGRDRRGNDVIHTQFARRECLACRSRPRCTPNGGFSGRGARGASAVRPSPPTLNRSSPPSPAAPPRWTSRPVADDSRTALRTSRSRSAGTGGSPTGPGLPPPAPGGSSGSGASQVSTPVFPTTCTSSRGAETPHDAAASAAEALEANRNKAVTWPASAPPVARHRGRRPQPAPGRPDRPGEVRLHPPVVGRRQVDDPHRHRRPDPPIPDRLVHRTRPGLEVIHRHPRRRNALGASAESPTRPGVEVDEPGGLFDLKLSGRGG